MLHKLRVSGIRFAKLMILNLKDCFISVERSSVFSPWMRSRDDGWNAPKFVATSSKFLSRALKRPRQLYGFPCMS